MITLASNEGAYLTISPSIPTNTHRQAVRFAPTNALTVPFLHSTPYKLTHLKEAEGIGKEKKEERGRREREGCE